MFVPYDDVIVGKERMRCCSLFMIVNFKSILLFYCKSLCNGRTITIVLLVQQLQVIKKTLQNEKGEKRGVGLYWNMEMFNIFNLFCLSSLRTRLKDCHHYEFMASTDLVDTDMLER